VGLLLQPGCGSSPPNESPRPAQEAQQLSKPTGVEQAEASDRPLAPAEAVVAATKSPALTEGDAAAAATTDHDAAEVQPAPERILVFTPRGPLLVHLYIQIDGQPQPAIAEHWLERVLSWVGATSGQEVVWTKLVEHPRIVPGRLGNAPLPGEKERADAIRQYDRNRDGRVQKEELASFFAGNTTFVRPFQLQALAASAGDPQSGPIYALIDVDRDGRLSRAEVEAAATRLKTRDADDNDVVALSDLMTFQPADEAPRGRSDVEPDLALDLADTSTDIAFYTLDEVYNETGTLDAEALALVPSLFLFLDSDGSGAVDAKEMARLGDAPPGLVLTAEFANTTPRPGDAKIAVSKLSDDLVAAGVLVNEQGGRLDLELPGGGLELSVLDDARARTADVPALFARLDADHSGLLEAGELQPLLTAVRLSLGEVDGNGDGKLSREECDQATKDSQPYSTVQAQAKVDRAADTLFAWLDQQRDGRLTARELRDAPRRLAELDRDGDGQVTPDEVPPRLTLVVSRGGGNLPALAMPRQEPPLVRAGPAWMTAMDRNRDGEISPREFLGTREQFAQLDADGDGFISADEANVAASGQP
jgi:Ca2+-binding EF-hand superfamily protein